MYLLLLNTIDAKKIAANNFQIIVKFESIKVNQLRINRLLDTLFMICFSGTYNADMSADIHSDFRF